MPKNLFSIVLLLSLTTISFGQKNELIVNYITNYKNLAIAEMKRTGVPAAITLAQGIHESGAGNSKLVLTSNNHFGIKCKSNWTGESVRHNDDAKGECFRKYPASEDSYQDHSNFLRNGERYASLFSLDPADYKSWANGLKKAGYATNPKYPEVLIKLIEDYQLQEYTYTALDKNINYGDILATDKDAIEKIVPGMGQVKTATPETVNANVLMDKTVYPSGEFKINDTKVVFVKKGTSYLSVAKQYNVDLAKIFDFNDISLAEVLNKDMLIYLQRKRKTGLNEFHLVQAGEALHDIAQQEAIRLESLKELNWLNKEENPAIGEKLSLKSKSTNMPRLAMKKNYSLVPATKKVGSN